MKSFDFFSGCYTDQLCHTKLNRDCLIKILHCLDRNEVCRLFNEANDQRLLDVYGMFQKYVHAFMVIEETLFVKYLDGPIGITVHRSNVGQPFINAVVHVANMDCLKKMKVTGKIIFNGLDGNELQSCYTALDRHLTQRTSIMLEYQACHINVKQLEVFCNGSDVNENIQHVVFRKNCSFAEGFQAVIQVECLSRIALSNNPNELVIDARQINDVFNYVRRQKPLQCLEICCVADFDTNLLITFVLQNIEEMGSFAVFPLNHDRRNEFNTELSYLLGFGHIIMLKRFIAVTRTTTNWMYDIE